MNWLRYWVRYMRKGEEKGGGSSQGMVFFLVEL